MADKPREIIERIELTRRDIGRTADELAHRLTPFRGRRPIMRPGPTGSRAGSPLSRPAVRLGLAALAGLLVGRSLGRRSARLF